MKRNKKIGWQKYESVIEDQLTSPFLQDMLASLQPETTQEEEEYYSIMKELQENGQEVQFVDSSPQLNLSEQFMNEISMLTNFDCWVGHTNFNLSKKIASELEKVEGVELLRICSRYRFFIGIGKMFDFKAVRKNLEKRLL
tara:strand:- start:1812 stop:2234 length:423 start_codon:yes stop_codon:yes gene_type:complete